MTTDYIYNPVLRQSRLDDVLDALSDFYYGSVAARFVVQTSFFIVSMGTIAALVFVAAA